MIFNNFLNNFNIFFERNKGITKILSDLFDYLSQMTHFFLFNSIGFPLFMLLLFIVPVAHSEEFIKFLIDLYSNPLNFLSCFKSLPLGLKIILSFYFFIIESVILCTLLAFIPLVKKEMVSKYNDEFIIKKRGYNMWSSSLRRVIISGVPLSVAAVVAGDVTIVSMQIEAVQEHNQQVWETYRLTKDKAILNQLQKIPTGGFSERIHTVSAKFYDAVVTWGSGSRTKD